MTRIRKNAKMRSKKKDWYVQFMNCKKIKLLPVADLKLLCSVIRGRSRKFEGGGHKPKICPRNIGRGGTRQTFFNCKSKIKKKTFSKGGASVPQAPPLNPPWTLQVWFFGLKHSKLWNLHFSYEVVVFIRMMIQTKQ